MIYQLNISCTKEQLVEIRHFVKEILQKHGYPVVESAKVILAVDEICANLIIHSNNCDPNEKLNLEVSYDDTQLVIEITDRGVGFDFESYKEPTVQELIETKKKGGLGLILVRRFMDDIQFYKHANRNICRLIKNLG